MCHVGTKSARSSIAPSPESQWELTLVEPPCPYYLDLNRRSRSDGRKLTIPSNSRTLAARSGEPPTNLLAGLDASLAHAPSRRIPSLRNSWRTGHTGMGSASPPGTSTRSCPICGRFQHLRVTVSPNPLGRRSLLLPSDTWSQESLRDWIPSSWSLYSTPGWFSNLGFATSSLPACANSKFERFEKSTNSCDPQARKATGGPEELQSHISATCPLWNPRETHLRLCRSKHRPIAFMEAGGFSTREVGRRPGQTDNFI